MFEEDLDAFLDPRDHGVEALYDGATTVHVIFDNAYTESFGIAGTSPVALGKASDFPAASAIDKTLVIGGTTYKIRNRQPQDDGAFVALQLEEQ